MGQHISIWTAVLSTSEILIYINCRPYAEGGITDLSLRRREIRLSREFCRPLQVMKDYDGRGTSGQPNGAYRPADWIPLSGGVFGGLGKVNPYGVLRSLHKME